jgi:hypothetical protein
MTAHDDDRVRSALRDAVPPVPEMPDRVAAVRRRAGRQRAQLWTQTLGAAASVLVLLGLTAAVAGGGGSRPVRPSSDPLAGLATKLAAQKSVSFEAWSQPAGPVTLPGMTTTVATEAMTGHVTGAFATKGTGRLDGDVGALGGIFFGASTEEAHLRLIDTSLYRNVTEGDHAPAGKKWVYDKGEEEPLEPAAVARAIRIATAFAENVRYVGGSTLRGTEVAEYELTVPGRWVHGDDITVTFALDGDGLPRQISARLPITRLLGYPVSFEGDPASSSMPPVPDALVDVRLELFGYGDDVEVERPPADEVIDQEAISAIQSRLFDQVMAHLEACLHKAGASTAARTVCEKAADAESGMPGMWHMFGTGPGEGCEADPDGNVSCDNSGYVSGSVTVTAHPVPLTPGTYPPDGSVAYEPTAAPPPVPTAKPSPAPSATP